MPAVTNTSPLIALATIGRLKLLKALYGVALMPPFVKVECIDRGKEVGARDVPEIENGIVEGWIQAANLNREETREARSLVDQARVGIGEAEALILARNRDILALLDDKEARAIAKSWNIQYAGTMMVLYEAFRKGLINHDELVDDLAKLTRVMWISTDVITDIIRRAKEVRR